VTPFATQHDFAQSEYSEDDDGDTIEVTEKVLARASREVDDMLLSATFDVDPETQLPTEQRVLQAVIAATCAQAAWFAVTGDISGAGSARGSISLGPLSIGGKATTGAGTADSRRSPEALSILRAAGLIPGEPGHG